MDLLMETSSKMSDFQKKQEDSFRYRVPIRVERARDPIYGVERDRIAVLGERTHQGRLVLDENGHTVVYDIQHLYYDDQGRIIIMQDWSIEDGRIFDINNYRKKNIATT